MMLALEGKIRASVFSEMLFRISRQTENKYDTCSGRRRRARSEPLSSQKCCSGQAGKERTSRHLFNRQEEGKMKELGDAIVVFTTRTR